VEAGPATPPIKVKLSEGVNLKHLVRELEGRLINDALNKPGETNRRRRGCSGQTDDVFREAQALRRNSSGLLDDRRGSLDEREFVWMKQSGCHRLWWSTTIRTRRNSLPTIWQREGFVPIQANSGAQCLKLVHENEVDVILARPYDARYGRLPGRQGAQDDPETAEIPIIMITARDDMDARPRDAPGGQRLPRQASIPPPTRQPRPRTARGSRDFSQWQPQQWIVSKAARKNRAQ